MAKVDTDEKLRTEIGVLRARIEALESVIKEIEWDVGPSEGCCPYCGRHAANGHLHWCRLGAALKG